MHIRAVAGAIGRSVSMLKFFFSVTFQIAVTSLPLKMTRLSTGLLPLLSKRIRDEGEIKRRLSPDL